MGVALGGEMGFGKWMVGWMKVRRRKEIAVVTYTRKRRETQVLKMGLTWEKAEWTNLAYVQDLEAIAGGLSVNVNRWCSDGA